MVRQRRRGGERPVAELARVVRPRVGKNDLLEVDAREVIDQAEVVFRHQRALRTAILLL